MTKNPFLLPLKDAVNFFAKKKVLPSRKWDDVASAYQSVAFTVASVTKASILKDIQELIALQLEKGVSPEKFREDFQSLMTRRGWNPNFSPYRVNLILSQNVRNSYQYGRWQQMEDPDLKRRRPYRQWVHGDSPIPRPHHIQQHLKCFPADADIWKAIHPSPFGCRCKAFALSDRDLEREGLSLSTPPRLQDIAEKGFSSGFPKNLEDQRTQLLEDAKNRLPPNLARLVEEDAQFQNKKKKGRQK